MSALALFAASFAVVFALGFQQMNVVALQYRLAFATSLVIGVAQLVQFKVLPGPTGALELGGYLLGSACGIVCAMRAHPALMRWRERRAAAPAPTVRDRLRAAGDTFEERDEVRAVLAEMRSGIEPDEPWSRAGSEPPIVKVEVDGAAAERAHLEADIAVDAAVNLLERACNVVPLGRLAYFDTADVVHLGLDTPNTAHLSRALRYLELREALIFHPQKRTLVRIKP